MYVTKETWQQSQKEINLQEDRVDRLSPILASIIKTPADTPVGTKPKQSLLSEDKEKSSLARQLWDMELL